MAATIEINKDGIDICRRFFQAIDKLIELGRMRGLGTFTRTNDLNYGNFFSFRKKFETSNSTIKPEWMMYICRDYDISPEWILMGTGDMFNKTPISKLYSVDIKALIDALNESVTINKRLVEKLNNFSNSKETL